MTAVTAILFCMWLFSFGSSCGPWFSWRWMCSGILDLHWLTLLYLLIASPMGGQ